MSRSHPPHSSLLCGTIKLRFLFNTLVTSTNPFFFFTTWIAQFSLRGLARHVRAVRDKGFVGFQPVGFHGCEEGRLDEGAFRGECGAGFDESESEGEGEGEVCVGLGDEERGGGPCGWEVEVRGVFQEEFCGGEVFGEGGEVEGRALVVIGVVGEHVGGEEEGEDVKMVGGYGAVEGGVAGVGVGIVEIPRLVGDFLGEGRDGEGFCVWDWFVTGSCDIVVFAFEDSHDSRVVMLSRYCKWCPSVCIFDRWVCA